MTKGERFEIDNDFICSIEQIEKMIEYRYKFKRGIIYSFFRNLIQNFAGGIKE